MQAPDWGIDRIYRMERRRSWGFILSGADRACDQGGTELKPRAERAKPCGLNCSWAALWRLPALLLILLVLAGCGPVHHTVDVDQGRLDTATPPLINGEVGQSFVACHPGLSAVEVLLVLYGQPSEPAAADEVWQCTLRRGSPQGPVLTRVPVRLEGRRHNDIITIPLPPQLDSQGQTYYISFRAESGNRAALWYDSVDAYADGAMFLDGRQTAGDIRFRTYYDEDVLAVLAQTVSLAVHGLWPLAAALLLLGIPGLALYLALGDVEQPHSLMDLGAWVASLTLAVLPLALLWTTAIGLRWQPGLLVLALAGLAGWSGYRLVWRGISVTWGRSDLFTLLLLALALATRFLEVRNLAVPAWVDSVHHTFITALIAAQGRVPATYDPAFPGGGFIYHFGFHTGAAALSWLAHLDPPRAVLIYGQILNALVAWTTSLLALRLSGRRVAAVTAVLVIGFLSPMPAYYVTWGRYTQLAGLTLLPLAIMTTMAAAERGGRRSLLLAAVTVAGLALTHYRVLAFYGGFCTVYVLWQTWERRRDVAALRRLWLRMAWLLGLFLLLVLPWIPRLWQYKAASILTGGANPPGVSGQNAMPMALLLFPGMRPLFYVAGLGALVALVRRRGALLVVLWAVCLYALVNLPLAGPWGSWFLPNSALAIAAFLPVTLLIADLAAVLWEGLQHLPRQWRGRAGMALSTAALALALVGAWRILPVINPQTVLVTSDDLAAMQWIRTHTPPDARFLVNVVPWQFGLYRGSDGGWWIPLLTGRACTLPPVLYRATTPAYLAEIEEVATAVSAGRLPGGDSWQERCRELGIGYIYVGATGGPLQAEQLRTLPGLQVVYTHGPVWIFQLAPEGVAAAAPASSQAGLQSMPFD